MEDNVGLSRRESHTSIRSLWRRKSTKKTSATNLLSSSSSLSTMDPNDDNDGPRSSQENISLAHSIIPDPLGELPAWFKRETEMAAANTSSFRIKYTLHNPNGPRWYRNYHLLPPPSVNRPPSVFSSSFPPMSTSVDRSEDSTRLPGPSRTPSSTHLPTPSSSQARIETASKPRSRKASQDNVDLMDVSDPSGTHWHHHSPYDAGISISPVSPDPPEVLSRTRTRLSSTNTGGARRKTVTPSPLSQSTSALHLQTQDPTHLTRKLSKRRKPLLAGFFGTHEKATSEEPEKSAGENPPSSFPKRLSVVPNGTLFNFGGSKRHSVSPMSISNGSTAALSNHSSKNDKRQSVLGRLVRKFSILRRSVQEPSPVINSEGAPGGAPLSVVDEQSSRRSFISQRQPSPEKKTPGLSKRVPPPRIDLDTESRILNGPSIEIERESSDRTSTISYDMPISPLGKLTIANPDAPSSGATTPVRLHNTLSPEVPSEPPMEPRYSVQDVLADRQHILKPPAPSSTGRASPVPGLLSPISVAVPAITFPELPHFTARASAHSPTPPISITPSPSSGIRLSTSAPAQSFIPNTIGDLLPPQSSPSLTKEVAYPSPPYLAPPTADDSPLSKASLLANPPTPYSADEPHSELPAFEKVPTDRSGPSKQSQDVSSLKRVSPTQDSDDRPEGQVRIARSNSTMSKKTETYRLVRHQSDKVSSSEEAAIQAEGDQWLLINSAEAPRRRRTKGRAEKPERIEESSSRTPRERRGKGVRERDEERGREGDKERNRDREKERGKDRWREGGRERERERERERSRERERDKERERDRDRERERERKRERERERERERDKERERERKRERERDRERERERERAREREREQERRRKQEKVVAQGNSDQRRTTSHTTAKSPPVERADSGSLSGRPGRARSLDTTQRPTQVQPLILALQDEPPRHRKSDDRPRNSVHQQDHSKTARAGPSPIVTVARVDHLPPMSARPTSELTSAADMSALKAREAWEMDRLWKGRSMVQGQRETPVIASPSNVESKGVHNETPKEGFSVQSFVHGSSHTSYVVQPLQAHPIPASVFYANMPAAPPPIIYAATSPYGQPHPPSSRDHTTYHSLSNSFSFPSKISSVDLPIRSNPLPVPPRESTYQPTHLPVLADRNSGTASEYWGNFANMPSHS